MNISELDEENFIALLTLVQENSSVQTKSWRDLTTMCQVLNWGFRDPDEAQAPYEPQTAARVLGYGTFMSNLFVEAHKRYSKLPFSGEND